MKIKTNCSKYLLTTAFGLMMLLITNGSFAQTFPTNDQCTSKDLELKSVDLPPNSQTNPCNCPEVRTLKLGIMNKTGSTRTSFAFWGTLVRTNPAGDYVDENNNVIPAGQPIGVSIYSCGGPIQKSMLNSITPTSGTITIKVNCGQTLEFRDLHLAWTTSNSNETCDFLKNNTATINPKCGTLTFIPINTGVNADVKEVNGTCATLASIGISPKFGTLTSQINYYRITPYGGTTTQVVAGGTVTYTSLQAGTYSYTIMDANGCTKEVEGTVTRGSAPSAPTLGAVQPTCAVQYGTITFTSSTTGLEFKLDNGSFAGYPTGGWSNLGEGQHTVTVRKTSDNTCQASTNQTINAVPSAPSAPTLGAVQPTCAVQYGTITVTSSTTGLEFKLDNGNFANYPTGGWSNLGEGQHTVTVRKTSDNTCQAITNQTINAVPSAPSAPTLGAVQPTCAVQYGTITVTSNTTGLEFKLDNGSFASYPTGGWSNLGEGQHTVTVRKTSDNTCQASTNQTINAVPSAPSAPTLGAVQPTCAVQYGTITVTSSTSGLEFKMDNGSFAGYPTGGWSNLGEGQHTVTVRKTNDKSCQASTNQTINAVPSAPSAPTLGAVQPTCAVQYGTITVTSSTSGLEFKMDNGSFAGYPTGGWSNLGEGQHTVTVRKTSDNTCQASTNQTINAVPSAPSAPTLGAVQPTCAVQYGTITVTSSTTGLEFKLDNGSFASYPTGGWSNLGEGQHTVTVRKTSDNTCQASTNQTINAVPSAPSAPTLGAVQPTCAVQYGTITVTSTTTSLEFKLDNGSFASYPTGGWSNLGEGQHTVTVRKTSDNTCQASTNQTINAVPTSPPAPTINILTNPSCSSSKGILSVTPTGGGPYDPSIYEFSDGGAFTNTAQFTFTAGAGYNITIRNVNDHTCTTTASCIGEQETNQQGERITNQLIDRITTQPINIPASDFSVTAFPNPYNDKIRFIVNSPESGNGSLELFNMLGQKIRTVYQGRINQGTQMFEVLVPLQLRSSLIYVMRLNQKQVSGKLLNIR